MNGTHECRGTCRVRTCPTTGVFAPTTQTPPYGGCKRGGRGAGASVRGRSRSGARCTSPGTPRRDAPAGGRADARGPHDKAGRPLTTPEGGKATGTVDCGYDTTGNTADHDAQRLERDAEGPAKVVEPVAGSTDKTSDYLYEAEYLLPIPKASDSPKLAPVGVRTGRPRPVRRGSRPARCLSGALRPRALLRPRRRLAARHRVRRESQCASARTPKHTTPESLAAGGGPKPLPTSSAHRLPEWGLACEPPDDEAGRPTPKREPARSPLGGRPGPYRCWSARPLLLTGGGRGGRHHDAAGCGFPAAPRCLAKGVSAPPRCGGRTRSRGRPAGRRRRRAIGHPAG